MIMNFSLGASCLYEGELLSQKQVNKACSYEPGLVGSSPEWDGLFLYSDMTVFIPPEYPASVIRNYVIIWRLQNSFCFKTNCTLYATLIVSV